MDFVNLGRFVQRKGLALTILMCRPAKQKLHRKSVFDEAVRPGTPYTEADSNRKQE